MHDNETPKPPNHRVITDIREAWEPAAPGEVHIRTTPDASLLCHKRFSAAVRTELIDWRNINDVRYALAAPRYCRDCAHGALVLARIYGYDPDFKAVGPKDTLQPDDSVSTWFDE